MAKKTVKKTVKKAANATVKRKPKEPEVNLSDVVWSNRVDPDDESEADDGPVRDLESMFGRPANGRAKLSAKESKNQGIAVGDHDRPPIGIAFPSFCLEMWTQQSVLQAESCYAVCGPTGAYKSHFAIEVARWILDAGGFVTYVENENKYNGDMAQGICGAKNGQKIWVKDSKSFTKAQEELLTGIKDVKSDPRYQGLPYLQILDSIVGNSTEGQQKRIKTNKGVERDWSSNALAASLFLPTYMPALSDYPLFGLWVTHSTDNEEKVGQFTKINTSMKGGMSWQYRCRLAIVIHRQGDKPKHDHDNWVVKLKLGLLKDAGVRGFTLPVQVKSTHHVIYDSEIDEYYKSQILRFCWDVASVNIMMDPGHYGYPESWSAIFKDILGLRYGKGARGKKVVVADKIGLDENPDNTAKKFMSLLYSPENKTTLDILRASLGIKKGIVITKGSDYDKLVAISKVIAAKRAAKAVSGNLVYIKKGEIYEDI